jgi:hypothetical protein
MRTSSIHPGVAIQDAKIPNTRINTPADPCPGIQYVPAFCPPNKDPITSKLKLPPPRAIAVKCGHRNPSLKLNIFRRLSIEDSLLIYKLILITVF